MKSQAFLLILALILLAVPACTAKPPSLYNSAWVLTELNGKPVETFLREPFFEQNFKASEDFISLKFSKNIISGKAGCKKYNGPYFALGNYLFTGKVFSDAILCIPDEINQLITDYLSALGRANHYENSGDQLRLLDLDDNILAVFTAQRQDLAGTRWQVMGFSPYQAYPLDGVLIKVNFGAAGKVSGTAGCKDFSASYEIHEPAIQIAFIKITDMICDEPDGSQQQEQQFLTALQAATTYKMEGNSLKLFTADDKIAVSLLKAP